MVNTVGRIIKRMGLQVAAEKTEVVRCRKRGGKRKKDVGVIVIEN